MWSWSSIRIYKKAHLKCLNIKWQGLIAHKSMSTAHASDLDIIIPLTDETNRPPLKLKYGKLARMADGSCIATLGSTSVLVTAVSKASHGPSQGFFPLTVDFRQKSAAAGRIPTNFLRRELGPTEKEILTARVIDRSLRPLFPKGYSSETQLVCNMLAVDSINDPDVLSINAASAALSMSDIPWNGPVGAVRVGKEIGSTNFIINPTRKELLSSELNLIVTGTENQLTIMLEAEAGNLDRYLFLDGIKAGLESCSVIASKLREVFERSKVIKRPFKSSSIPQETIDSIVKDIELLCEQKIRCIYSDASHDKISRDKATFSVRDQSISEIKANYPGCDHQIFFDAFGHLCRKIVADLALNDQRRVDGRAFDQLRKISCEVDLYPPLHGSALFQRGQTQVFCTVALDTLESALKSDAVSVLLGGIKERNFFLHYEFPQFAVNDIGKSSGIGRRELGHGALAEKALRAIIPKNFPFTIRLTSEVLESNGSSSMASVCGGTLALLDAGVPISSPAAGVAVGLVSRPSKEGDGIENHAVLLDIQGLEDYLGDMDFKMAGTRTGITALQADIKIAGLEFKIVEEAVQRGYFGICNLLDIMAACQSSPKTGKSNWPVTEKLVVPIAKRAKFIGPGGQNLKRLLVESGVQVTPHPDDSNAWSIFAPNMDAMAEGKELIDKILTDDRVPDFDFGAIYPATIVEIRDHGVMVQLHPEMQPVLISNSQLDAKKISHPSALNLTVGQELLVKYYGRDPVSGSVRLSRKVLTMSAASAVKQLRKSTRSQTIPETPGDVKSFKNSRPKIQEFYTDDDSSSTRRSEEFEVLNNGCENGPSFEEEKPIVSISLSLPEHLEQTDEEEKIDEQKLEEDDLCEQEVVKEDPDEHQVVEENPDEHEVPEDHRFEEENPECQKVDQENPDENIFADSQVLLDISHQEENPDVQVEESDKPKKRFASKRTFLQRIVFREQGLLLLAEKWKNQSQYHYYNLDILLNKVMTLNNEILETQERLRLIERDVEITRKAYLLLSSSRSIFITDDQLSKKFSEYMVLEAKRRATHETLSNQRVSYKTAVEDMLKVGRAFQNSEKKVKQSNTGVDATKVVALLKVLNSCDSLPPGVYTGTILQKSKPSLLFLLDNGQKVKLSMSKILCNQSVLDNLTPGTRTKICSVKQSESDNENAIFEIFPVDDSIWKDFDAENFSYLLRRDVWRE